MTRRNELILAGIGALLVLVAATLLLVRPTRQATAEARAERDTAISDGQALRDQIKALEALKPKEAELRAKASLAKAEYPATPALPALVDALQDAASLSGSPTRRSTRPCWPSATPSSSRTTTRAPSWGRSPSTAGSPRSGEGRLGPRAAPATSRTTATTPAPVRLAAVCHGHRRDPLPGQPVGGDPEPRRPAGLGPPFR